MNPLKFSPQYSSPLYVHQDEKKSKKDWIKISAIVAAVIGGVILALGALCIGGILPPSLVGGKLGVWLLIATGGSILAPAAYTIYKRWNKSDSD